MEIKVVDDPVGEIDAEVGIEVPMGATEEQAAPPVAVDPVEEAAEKFTKLLPYVAKIARSTNNKGLVRVLHAFAEFPLGSGKPRLSNHSEKLLFNMLQEIQGYKSTILQDFMKKNLEKMQADKLAEEQLTKGNVTNE